MAWDSNMDGMYNETITVAEWLSADMYGDPAFSTSTTTVTALIQQTAEIITDSAGEDSVTTAIAYVNSTSATDCPATARYTLPDGSQPDVLRIDRHSDEDGLHSQVIYFGGAIGT
jgi:hypothetical protein